MSGEPLRIIAIDGPAGAGKSTLARELARRLSWSYLDTGALYRALAWVCLARGADPGDQAAAETLAAAVALTIRPGPAGSVILADGEDVTPWLRAPEISLAASAVSAWPGVRAALLNTQRDLGAQGEMVAEGRDMGSVVFPAAGLKIFLFASPEVRAGRRRLELLAQGLDLSPERVLAEIMARDEADSSRPVAPLKPAPDAMALDSSGLDIEAALEIMLKAAHLRFGLPAGTRSN